MFKTFGPAIAWMSIIFIISSLTGAQLTNSEVTEITRKFIPSNILSIFVHIIEFAILTLLYFRAGIRYWPSSKITVSIISITLSICYGVSDEFHQSFIKDRDQSWMDVLYDTFGSIIALGIIITKQKLSKHKINRVVQ